MSYRWMPLALLLAAPNLAVAKDARPSLEQRVQRMEDESAIRRILIEYGADLDAKDYHAYAGLFAHDGVWQGGFGTFTGPAAIEKMLVDNLGAPEPGFVNKANFHLLTNPIIAIDGDRAHVTSKYLFWTATDGKPTPLLAGRWGDNGDCKQDVLLREDGTFQSYTGGEGRWSVESDVLTMAGAGGEVRLRVVELERDRMTVENDDGSIGHSQRCDGGVPATGEAQAQN